MLVGEEEGEVERSVEMARTNGLKAFGWREVERVGDGIGEREKEAEGEGGRVVGELEVLVELVGEDEKGVSTDYILSAPGLGLKPLIKAETLTSPPTTRLSFSLSFSIRPLDTLPSPISPSPQESQLPTRSSQLTNDQDLTPRTPSLAF